jgi:23S rRNA (guanosine2251-2'-O)-methyltransferase
MYNHLMPMNSYEIRVCVACGLRYPLVEGHPFGTRCPVCMGDTHVVLSQKLSAERFAPNEPRDESGKTFAVLLDNIRSAWNVGSILRSADGFGFTHAFLCGITPAADNEAVIKTSLGAENSVPWSYHKDAVKLLKGLKSDGWKVYALEEDARAISIDGVSATAPRMALGASAHEGPGALRERQVFIVGNEVTGVDPELLDLCDQIFYIPMRGEKKSFNVAIAFGIAAYALRVKNKERLS